MVKVATLLVVSALGVQQAAATFGLGLGIGLGIDWKHQQPYNAPGYSVQTCNAQQTHGWDWGDLGLGSVSAYGGFNFHGWTCQSSFGIGGLLRSRNLFGGLSGIFGGKCITGKLSSLPQISCASSISEVSIGQYWVSSDKDTTIHASYSYPDGSSCVQEHACGAGGAIIQNSQCGGATGVTFSPAAGASDCNIGIHSVSFYCASSQAYTAPPPYQTTTAAAYTPPPPVYTTTTPAAVYTPPAVVSTTPAYTPPPATTYEASSTYVASSAVVSSYVASSVVATTYVATTPVYTTYAASTYEASTYESTSAYVATSVSAGSTYVASTYAVYTHTVPASTYAAVSSYIATSAVASSYVDTTPVYSTYEQTTPVISSYAVSTYEASTYVATSTYMVTSVSAGSTYVASSYQVATYTAPASTYVAATTYAAASYSAAPPPSGTYAAPANCPTHIPKCLNTHWFMLENKCKDNTDADCYCLHPEYTQQVMSCIDAHGEDDLTKEQAYGCFAGLCAGHLAENPCPVTAIPSSITIIGKGAATGAPAPQSVITINTVLTVPAVCTTGPSSGMTYPGSSTTTSVQTTVTVPQVALSTNTAGPTPVVVPIAGTAPAAAGATVTTDTTPAATSAPAIATGGASKTGVAVGLVAVVLALAIAM